MPNKIRYTKITEKELRKIVRERSGYEFPVTFPMGKNGDPTISGDVSPVVFDTRGYSYTEPSSEIDGLRGYHTLENGFTFLGWEIGGSYGSYIFFVVYWDGNLLRAYVPREGNTFNLNTNKYWARMYNSQNYARDAGQKHTAIHPDYLDAKSRGFIITTRSADPYNYDYWQWPRPQWGKIRAELLAKFEDPATAANEFAQKVIASLAAKGKLEAKAEAAKPKASSKPQGKNPAVVAAPEFVFSYQEEGPLDGNPAIYVSRLEDWEGETLSDSLPKDVYAFLQRDVGIVESMEAMWEMKPGAVFEDVKARILANPRFAYVDPPRWLPQPGDEDF